jgi:hypothetical protein
MDAWTVEMAIRRHIDHRQTIIIPEISVPFETGRPGWGGRPSMDAYRADFIRVSSCGYATEIEVKVSISDWKADLKKSKVGKLPPWISMFVYAVPEELGIPDFVPSHAGVWHVTKGINARYGGEETKVRVARAPKRIGDQKIPSEILDRWNRSMYYRYWDLLLIRDNEINNKRKRASSNG